MEKSAIKSALPAADMDGHHLTLSAKLKQQSNGQKKGFDLAGTIEISDQKDNFPTNFSVPAFSLRPAWPGYHVVCFADRGGNWVLPGRYGGVDKNFSGASQITNGVYTIQFTWRNQGAGWRMKPEQFAAYDVAVTISDSQNQQHLLSQLNVPTK